MKLDDLKEAISRKKQIKIWVKDTPDDSGHLLNPYAILEDATMTYFVYCYNEEQKRILMTRVSAVTKLEVIERAFKRPDNWDETIDATKFYVVIS